MYDDDFDDADLRRRPIHALEVRVSPGGQITIPKALRDTLGFRPGSRAALSVEAFHLRLVPECDLGLPDPEPDPAPDPRGPATLHHLPGTGYWEN